MATELAAVSPPSSKSGCQRVIRRFGYTGYKIDRIEEPETYADRVIIRVYVLTAPIWKGTPGVDGGMVRVARTILLHFGDDEVWASDEDGWVV